MMRVLNEGNQSIRWCDMFPLPLGEGQGEGIWFVGCINKLNCTATL